MNSSKKRKIQQPTIPCSWIDCNVQCNNDWELNGHIETHLEYLKQDSGGNFNCGWGTCEYKSECKIQIHRHIFYHGYYNGLLVQGKYELQNNTQIPRCNAPPRECDKIPELIANFCCEWTDCERTFVSIVEFQDHIVQHASFEYEIQKSPDDERPKIQCNWNFCKKQMDNRYRLIEHIRTHSNKKQVACFHCGELFRTKTTLFDHLRRQPDNNTQKYQCAQCFKYFATEKLLRSHMIKHVNCFKCSMCDMTCSSASALATHVRYRHLKDKPFKCVECDYRCVRESDLNQHVQLVHSQEVHRCEEPGCTYAVKTFQALRRHFLEIHKNTTFIYICHCCEKPFKNGKTLSAHLIKKHDFQLPSGHRRFTYRIDENGFYRLETTRIESLEVTEQILTPNSIETNEITQESNCYEIVSKTNEQDAAQRMIVSNTKNDNKLHFLEIHKNTTFIYICHCCEKPFKNGKTLSAHLIKKHDFQLPSGHRRFTYRIDENGFYRLETTRIESLEVTEQILTPNSIETNEITQESNCYEIVSKTNEQDAAQRMIVSNTKNDNKLVGEVLISLPCLD